MSSANINSQMAFAIVVIIMVSIIAAAVNLALDFGIVNLSQAQKMPLLTPQQKAATCHPNDKFVNTTESVICGLPKSTPSTNSSYSGSNNNATTNHRKTFTAVLSGNQKVPPKKTLAIGSGKFTLNADRITVTQYS